MTKISHLHREKEVNRIGRTRKGLPLKRHDKERERIEAENDQIFGTHKIHDLQNSSSEFAKEWSPLHIRADGEPNRTGLRIYRDRIQVVNEDPRHVDHEIIPVMRTLRLLNGKEKLVYVQHILATEQDCDFYHKSFTKAIKTIKQKDKRVLDIKANLKGVKASSKRRLDDILVRARKGGL